MKKIIIFSILVLSLYASWLAQEAILILGYFISGLLIAALIIVFIFSVWWLREKMLVIRATRIEAQKQSEVLVIKSPTGIWVRDTGNAKYQALHLDQSDTLGWQIYNGPKSTKSPEPLLLEAPQELKPIMDRLKTGVQILISGPTKSGKTTLCKHLLTYLVSQNYSIIPCDIHSPGKMLGYDVIGSGRKFQDIFNALEVLIETMNGRYNDLKYNADNPSVFPGLAIFIDELTTLVKEAKKSGFSLSDVLETLLTEGRKVNIMLVLSIHSLDVKTLGLTAGIRENNIMVQLYGGQGMPHSCYEVPPLANIRSKKNWIEHQPIGPYVGYPEIENVVTKMPDAKNIKIQNLSNQGFSSTAIARNIFSTKKATGPQIKHIQDILATL